MADRRDAVAGLRPPWLAGLLAAGALAAHSLAAIGRVAGVADLAAGAAAAAVATAISRVGPQRQPPPAVHASDAPGPVTRQGR